MEHQGRRFRGLDLFNELLRRTTTIDLFDTRPISKIPLSEPTIEGGVECKTVTEYLKARYRDYPGIKRLIETQPGVRGRGYTYAPQFLHRSVSLEEVPDEILNEETFFMDTKHRRRHRNTDKPARRRWEISFQHGSVSVNASVRRLGVLWIILRRQYYVWPVCSSSSCWEYRLPTHWDSSP